MVLIIENNKVKSVDYSLETFFEKYPCLSKCSREFADKKVKTVARNENCLYVGQREMAICSKDDDIDIIGSEDATTCHIIIVRDVVSNTTALAHLDTPEDHQFLELEQTLVSRISSDKLELEVYLVGGFDDDRGTSQEISKSVFSLMMASDVSYELKLACIGPINTVLRDGTTWPIHYGVAVDLKSGALSPATFECHGPDPDIRSLWCEEGLHNLYDNQSGHIIIQQFEYSVWRYPDRWLQQSDETILKYCSTSPTVEPPSFCDNMR